MEENRFPGGESKQLLTEEIYKEYLSIRAGEPVVLIGTPISVVDAIRLAALRRVLLLFNVSEQSLAVLRDVPGAKRCIMACMGEWVSYSFENEKRKNVMH